MGHRWIVLSLILATQAAAESATYYEVWRSATPHRIDATRIAAWLPYPTEGWLDKTAEYGVTNWYWVRAVTAERRYQQSNPTDPSYLELLCPIKAKIDQHWLTPIRYRFRLKGAHEGNTTCQIRGEIYEGGFLPWTTIERFPPVEEYHTVTVSSDLAAYEEEHDILVRDLARHADNFAAEIAAVVKYKMTRPYAWLYWNDLFRTSPDISVKAAYTMDPAPDWLLTQALNKPDGLLLVWDAIPGMTTEFSAAPLSGVKWPLPVIVQQPQHQSVPVGSNATFTAYATNHAPLAYQWFKDGVALAGQTATNLVILSATNSDVGGYSVVISNDAGAVASLLATLTVGSADGSQVLWISATCYCPTYSLPLKVGVEHLVEVSDTYILNPTFSQPADAEFCFDYGTGNWTEVLSGDPSQDKLDLLVNESSIDWLGSADGGITWASHTFSTNHIYRYSVVGSGTPVSFAISDFTPYGDAFYWDNSGGLLVTIRPVIPLPGMGLSSSALTNRCAVNENCQDQFFTVRNTDTSTIAYAVSVSAPWIVVIPTSGSSGGEADPITVTYQTARLPAGEYNGQIVVAAPGATNSPQVVSVHLTVTNSATLTDALDWPGQEWTASGPAPWAGQVFVSHDGEDSARSGPIDDDQQCMLETTVTGPGTLHWWWKVSSESDWDYLKFHFRGGAQFGISGERDWEERSFYVPPGTHAVQWSYSKDRSGRGGQDAAWVDQVSFEPSTGLTIVSAPQPQTSYAGSTALFSVLARGEQPISYQWQRVTGGSTNSLPGATESSVLLTNLTPTDAGYYSVTVSNVTGVTNVGASLAVQPLPPFEMNSMGQESFGGGFVYRFWVRTPPGADSVQIEVSSNLVTWTPIYTNPTPAEEFVFGERASSNQVQRFYRAVAR